MRRLCTLFAVCALVSCGRARHDDSGQVASAAATAPRATGWSHGGVPIAPATMLAVGRAGESALRVTMASGPIDCEELRREFPRHDAIAGSTMIDFWLVEPLLPDGRRDAFAFRSARRIDGSSTAALGRGLVARAALLGEVRITDAAVELKGLELALQDRGEPELFEHAGDTRVKNCGRIEDAEAPHDGTTKAPLPEKKGELTLTLGGKTHVVRGATLRPFGKQMHLRLSAWPHRCDSWLTEGYDAFLEVTFAGDPLALSHATLLGDAVPPTATGSKGREAFSVSTVGKLDAPGPITLRLSGTLDLGGYVVALAGEVAPQRCTSGKP